MEIIVAYEETEDLNSRRKLLEFVFYALSMHLLCKPYKKMGNSSCEISLREDSIEVEIISGRISEVKGVLDKILTEMFIKTQYMKEESKSLCFSVQFSG